MDHLTPLGAAGFRTRALRAAALAGMLGPLLLGGVIVGLTLAQYEFMRSLRWHPLTAPTTDWPSGLALGPYGFLMVGAFIGSGVLLVVFAIGLHWGVQGTGRSGPLLLAGAGGALALLGSKTDPTYGNTPRTLHGALHDGAYILLGLTLLPAMLVFARRFQSDPAWRGHARYTVVTLLVIVPSFVIKGVAFYLFLIGILLWIEITAIRLWRCVASAPARASNIGAGLAQ